MNLEKVQRLYEYYQATEYTESERQMALSVLNSMKKYEPKLLMAVGFALVDGLSRNLKDGNE